MEEKQKQLEQMEAFSSDIEIQLQCLLGHCRKEFEGELSAEKLGSKYGGYGSFLPTRQRSPTVLLQYKTPSIMQKNSIKMLPNKPVVKLVAANSGGTVLSAKDASAANNILPGSAFLADDVAKSGEISVIADKNGRESEDNQLEEGEIPFYQDHDSNYYTDVALSYIDIKLQNILGHHRKEFEGEILAKNLGSKFGCYGSFLPTHQRPPSVFLQPKTPAIVENNSTQKLPNEAVVEHIQLPAANSGGAVLSRMVASAVLAADVAKNGEMAVSAVKGSKEISPFKKDSTVKTVKNCDQKKVKLQTQMGSGSVPCSKNSAIYSSLDLEKSIFPSLEDIPDDAKEFSPENEFTLAPSPLSIIQIMTSDHIPGGSLVTHLRDFMPPLLERDEKFFAKEPENLSVKTEFQKDPLTNRNDFESVKAFQGLNEHKGISSGNKRKYIEIKETSTKFGKNAPNNLKRPTKSSSKESRHGRQEREIIRESKKLTYRKGAKEASKDKIHQAVKKEKWVMCNACDKWRLLPFWVEPSSLPKKWFCQMLYWLPDMNRCDISEYSTAQAINGTYGIQLDQCQVDANKEHLQHPGSMNHSSSLSEKNNRSSVKSRRLTDVVQQPLKKVQAGTRILHQVINRNGVEMGTQKFKQEKWKLKQNASNKGSKYGGYGSFLPTHQRSPTVLLQYKTPSIMQKNSIKMLPIKPVVKLVAANSGGTVLSAKDASAGNNILPGSGFLADDVAKSGEISVTADKNSRESEDNPLEEGEIPFYQDHDSNYYTDVALSYIDIKLQNILGHHRKEFEGEISAKNLGSKFGCYGSFLPTHQRPPSVFLQPETPAIVQNNSTQKLPNEAVVEHIQLPAANSGGTVLSRMVASAVLVADVAKNGEMAVSAVKGSKEISPFKKDSTVKTVKICDQKKVKLQTQMGSGSIPCSKNSAIYSSLDPEKSIFPSLEDIPDDAQEFSPENEFTLAPSPLSIIQIMTSDHIPGGSLVTPLRDFLPPLLERDEKFFAKEPENLSVKTEFQKDPLTNRNDFESVKAFQGLNEHEGISSGNKRKYKEIKEASTKFGKNAPNNLKRPTKSSSKESRHGRQEREIIRESKKLTYRKGAKEASKDKIHQSVKKEKWVMCDACDKWRLLPFWVEPSSLPKKWFCQMLYWLPDMNRCDISEFSTAQAINGTYGIQLDQCQVDANKEHLQHPGSMNHSSSLSEKNNRSSVKSGRLTDVVQQPLKKVQAGARILHQVINRNGVEMGTQKFKQEKWKLKQNASNKAEGSLGQGKRKNEVEAGVHKSLKKTKARVTFDGSNSELSTVPRESRKVDNLHGALIPSVKLLASNVSIGSDHVGAVASSSVRRELGQAAGNTVLKEAKDLKRVADRLKATGGGDQDIRRLYFEAALKFLHGASLLESSKVEIAKHGEIPQSMKLYIYTARLFELCASTYERNKEMAAAALAYQCMGVAHMRVFFSKTLCLTRDWHELHAALQNAPLGESPKLSSSYGDNSNKQAIMDKTFVNPTEVDGSPQVAAIAIQHPPQFLRVLEYTQDMIAGMEAFRKSEIAFAAAIVSVPDGKNATEKMFAVKSAIDFSFQDIDGLLQLVRIALEAIYD